jgi:hypothetical protein
LLIIHGFSQDKRDKSLLSLTFGPSLPLGDYHSTDINNSKAGFAGFGGNVNISYAHLLHKNFGIAASLLGQLHPLNTKAMEKSFDGQKFYTDFVLGTTGPGQALPPPNPNYITYSNWKFNKKSYMSGAALVGLYGDFPLTPAVSIVAKAMAGAADVSSPELKGQAYNDTSLIMVDQKKVSAIGFAYALDAGVKYNLTKRISLLASVEYFTTANIKFKNVTSTSFIGIYPVIPNTYLPGNYSVLIANSNTVNAYQKLSSLNINIGIGLRL